MTEAQRLPNDSAALLTVPEPGQLVDVRRRQWIVSDVQGASIGTGKPQHLVTLSSIDEDALGETVQVVWEVEPGAHVIERAGLPHVTGVDDAERLEAFLDAVRWGAATNADRGFLQAPFRSGVSIEDFQLDPLVRAIDMARANLLIADDVGLGKTIEAGLVVQELLVRHRARTVLILCPASLQEKWRTEMLEKFGLEFRIVDTDYVKHLRRERGLHANPWTSHPRLITSIDWAKSGEGLQALRDTLPSHVTYPRKFDVLIVDEAHNVAPSASAHYLSESQRTRLVRLIAPHFQHKLFLTATPHDGYTESFTALLELLDDQRFARNVPPDEKRLSQVMIRRLKSELVDAEGKALYPKRRLEALYVSYTQEERETQQLLERYIQRRETGAQGEDLAHRFVHQLLRKRLFSSPAAFATTLERHVATLEGRSLKNDRERTFDDRILRKAISRVDEDYADDREAEAAQAEAVEEASRHTRSPTSEERRMLDELREWAQEARSRPDAKAKAILQWIERHLKTDGQWNDQRVILFTEYRTTHQWMHEILASHGLAGERVGLIYGGMDPKEREAVKAAFQASPDESPVRILLATDAASEGIDLQNHCHLLIHLEIPYNPNVMEQRNGRIDRHGQRAPEVVIWHPVDAEGGHGEDILRALRKLEAMRADMGSVNPVIAPQIPDLLEGRRRELDTSAAEERMRRARRFVKAERDLRERVTKLHERLLETRRDFHLDPEHIHRAVRVGLELAGKPPLVPVALAGAPDGTAFRMPELAGSWARCLEGLEHPYNKKIRPITFDHDVAKGRDDVVLVHLNHPLVQMSLRLLRAEVWAHEGSKKLNRVTVRALPDDRLDGPAVAVVSRLVMVGGNHHRLHEELTEAGGYLREGTFRREERVTEVRRWLDEATPVTELSPSLLDSLRARFDRHREDLLRAIDARSRERLRGLASTLDARRTKEVEDILEVLTELQHTLETELHEELPLQLPLLTPDEHTQLKRDRAALEARLARIPDEREQEVLAIEARYSNLTERTFPVAVVLLVPGSLLNGRYA
ncbi:superfamily II DNA or RNA helicase [Deinobacterium chartae]|uniref:Superfamily II DNA or RNA helicase n=1 Tax=Deinobacterium chartae TaxID=521158 RepID=A0A841I305_9DEIO|nr:DISARM system SNF2-like helicase DrmD [Deinobacterium chartae]MBB6099404.1 superfamily II DNA or RNA helicase [Deinobacterium chartae]